MINVDLAEVRGLRRALAGEILCTPTIRVPSLESKVRSSKEIHAKLEFLQRTGTFKARGALATLTALSAAERASGVTAVSAGNHAIAVAYAARALAIDAKLVMLASSNPARIKRCEALGGQVVLADDVHAAFAEVERIQASEGRVFVHPFEGQGVVHGTASLGLELLEQIPDADVVIVPIGGGGLCAGVSAAIKQLRPSCSIYGVEPVGAASMHESFRRQGPVSLTAVSTIADSLGAPHAMPQTFALCRKFVDEIVLVTDEELRSAMGFLFAEMHVAVEPACAASTAALLGPLSAAVQGRKVVIIMCGSNIDWATYERQAFVA